MTARPFGTMPDGRVVQVATLRAGELTARVLTLGATLQDLRLAGTPWPLILGSDMAGAYDGALLWAGAVVGPVANRIGGAQVTLAGRRYALPANDGANSLHSGPQGLSARIWQIEAASDSALCMICTLAPGDCGLPGHRIVRARYRIVPPATLELVLEAETDTPTLMNPAHHVYWNLDGSLTTGAHRLQIDADRYLPCDAQGLPGAPLPVAGTGFDLRTPRPVNDLPPLDHNFCLGDTPAAAPRPVAQLRGARGVQMVLETDAPGLQAYDGRALNSTPYPGLMGQPYVPHAGLALEPQFWPNAPHHPDFPQITLTPGMPWRQTTRYHIARTEDLPTTPQRPPS